MPPKSKKRLRTQDIQKIKSFDSNASLFAGDLTVLQLQHILREKGVEESEMKTMKKAALVQKLQSLLGGGAGRVKDALDRTAAEQEQKGELKASTFCSSARSFLVLL